MADDLLRRTRSMMLDGHSAVIDHVDACNDLDEDDVHAVVRRAETLVTAVRHDDGGSPPDETDEVDETVDVDETVAAGASAQM